MKTSTVFALLAALIAAIALLSFYFAATSEAHFGTGCQKGKCKWHVVKPFNDRLERMARCESTSRWYLDDLHDGGLQFHPDTWRRTGSRYVFAHHASKLEQKYRAVVWAWKINWAWRSTMGWPRCG